MKWLAVSVVAIALIIFGATHVLMGGAPVRLDSYRVIDAQTIVVEAERGELDWVRLVKVEETHDEIRVSVGKVSLPLIPTAAVGYPVSFEVDLESPLGNRVVRDGFGEVPRRP